MIPNDLKLEYNFKKWNIISVVKTETSYSKQVENE